MKRAFAFVALLLWSVWAWAALSTAQYQTLAQNMRANPNPAVVAALQARNDGELARLYNLPSTFIVWKVTASTMDVGKVINYIAVASMTTANTDRLQLFVRLNPTTFDPSRSDVRQFFADTFSGALGGQGQATRDALEALYRRAANECERLFATGTGTTATPGTLGVEHTLSTSDVSFALNNF